jgi:hypothetical protein
LVTRSLSILAAALVFACPASASARERDVPHPGPLPAGAQLEQFDSTVVQSEVGAMRTARAAARAPRNYATPDGYSVAVEASSDYPMDPVADQKLVDFLASRTHGTELGDLSVYVGTPAEIVRICGGDSEVVACYAIDEARMYVPGEAVRGIPVEYPLTHEYGHHVASRRLNTPWDALDWGAKYWSSAMRICSGVRHHLLFPGNQGAHYWDDPGEGFADGYAHMHYPDAPWFYNQLMRPSAKCWHPGRGRARGPSMDGSGGATSRAPSTSASRSTATSRWRSGPRAEPFTRSRRRRRASPPAGDCATPAASGWSGAASARWTTSS